MVNTFAKVFAPAFLGLFSIIFFWLVLLPKIRRCREKRACRREYTHNPLNDTELTTVTGSADITRLSAADFPSHPVALRDYHGRPGAARLARRSGRLSTECQNPFADPPNYSPSFETLPTTPRSRWIPNFSTPTRHSRYQASAQDTSFILRPAPAFSFTDPLHPVPNQDLRSSPSQAFSDYSERAVSVVAFPDPAYQPTKLSLPDLARCEPRSAGQAPPLGRKLDQFPLPTSGSAHLHPNTVFTQVAADAPPTPPATVTKDYFTGTTGAKTPVSKIRQLFDHEKMAATPSLHAAKPSIAASSMYSRDELGVRREGEEKEEEAVVSSPPCFSRLFPQKKAPGGAEWL